MPPSAGTAAASAYVYAADNPVAASDPTGLTPLPKGPGDGVWMNGSDAQHQNVLTHAYWQEATKYGIGNVYADVYGYRGVTGMSRVAVAVKWTKSGEGFPDLIAYGADTPTGKGYAVWDVKPATLYGRSYIKSVNKLAGYGAGLAERSGYPVMLGPPIDPSQWWYNQDGLEGLMTMFNGADWSATGIPEPTAGPIGPGDIAPLAQSNGLIFYRLLKFGKKDPVGDRLQASAELSKAGISEEAASVCQPTGVDLNSATKLRYIGDVGNPGATAEQLIDSAAPLPAYTGPISINAPTPFGPVILGGSQSATAATPNSGWHPGWKFWTGLALIGGGLLLSLLGDPEMGLPAAGEGADLAGIGDIFDTPFADGVEQDLKTLTENGWNKVIAFGHELGKLF